MNSHLYRWSLLLGLALVSTMVMTGCPQTGATTPSPTAAATATQTTQTPTPAPGPAYPVVGTRTITRAMTTVMVAISPTYGQYLATPAGLPLYTYSGDSPGTSNVTGNLLALWPAFTAPPPLTLPAGVGGTLSFITRPDGSQQVAYNQMPLYTFVTDSPGNVTGQNVQGFSLAVPQ
ncbi:MAG: COG4315 family predicted lipoprotein [Chloroflexota bacterium]